MELTTVTISDSIKRRHARLNINNVSVFKHATSHDGYFSIIFILSTIKVLESTSKVLFNYCLKL